MSFYSKKEKVEICVDISKKLKYFENTKGQIDLFNNDYTFIPKLKQIFQDYINGCSDFKGVLHFEEIDKQIEYYFPISKQKKAKFVIKM